MHKIYHGFWELIGNTPLVRVERYQKENGLNAEILVKLEALNPAGSVKDRVALGMIEEAEAQGRLAPGALIIEPTSGNTGIGLAAVAASKGYRAVFTMPDTMSQERQKLLKAYGAQVVLTPGAQGMAGAIAKAEELCRQNPGSFLPGQFENPANPRAHMQTTGPEIWEAAEGRVDLFVAGIGTGGTISGTGAFLKQKDPAIRVVGVEPSDSAVLSGKPAGPHKIQGIGAGFVPKILERDVVDEILQIDAQDAFCAARQLARMEGFLVGISSGAALHAAKLLAERPENTGKRIVALLPDSGDRYLSTEVFL